MNGSDSDSDSEHGNCEDDKGCTSLGRNDKPIAGTEKGRDGTVQTPIPGPSGRKRTSNVIKDTPEPTRYAACRIKDDSPLSAFRLIVDDSMIRLIQ